VRIVTELPPGPPLPGPLQTAWYTFDQPGFWAVCRKRYGRTFSNRMPGFPPIVVTSDRDAIRRLFTGDPMLRRHGNDLFRPMFGDRSLLLLEPAEHLGRRRLELPPFHGEAVRAYADRIRELAEAEVASWRPGERVVTHPRTRALTLEVILELVLGVRDRDLRDELGALIDWFNTPLNNLVLFLPPSLGQRAWWNLPAKPAYARLDRFHELLRQHIAQTRRDPGLVGRRDVLALLVRARGEDGSELSDADLRDELVTLVIAGHETTATAMAWACDLLAHNRAVTARIRSALACGEREYLKAAAKEVLRARTLAYASAGRHVLESFPIGEWVIEPETTILVDAQGVHADPELYPEPEQFRPERFLEDPPDGYAYVPFGGGAHRCLGAALAMLELELFLEVVVTQTEPTPAGSPARPVRRGPTLAPDNQGRIHIARPARMEARPQPTQRAATLVR
jgi:cytochrome P450